MMRQLLVLVLIVSATILAVPARAQEQQLEIRPHAVVRALAAGRIHARDLDFSQLPIAARITMFAGTEATVSLIALGDKSPLKAAIPALAWAQLVAQLPRLAQAGGTMQEALIAQVVAGLEKNDVELPRNVTLAAGGMVVASGKVDDLLKRATLVFSARAVLNLARDSRVSHKLALMAIDPRVPSDVRKQAGIAAALGMAVDLQETIAEANLLKDLGGF